MGLPSFDDDFTDGVRGKPRIQVLEIRDPKQPDGEPIAWVMVERQVTYKRDKPYDPVYEASIRLSFEQILPKYERREHGKGEFCGHYSMHMSHDSQDSVSLTSSTSGSGAVFLDPPSLRGLRIGTYLMNEIVMWAQRWPDAIVNSVSLSSGQARDDNKDRRNWFYEQFGLVFDYSDTEHTEGRSRPMPVKELIQVDEWKKNITERRMVDYLADVLYAERDASSELKHRTKVLHERIADIRKAEASPIRWALKMLYYKYAGIVTSGTVLVVFSAALWWHFKGY